MIANNQAPGLLIANTCVFGGIKINAFVFELMHFMY